MATVVLSAGHNKGTGARAHDGTDEWSWSMLCVRACEAELKKMGHQVVILYRDVNLSYTKAMRKLADQMKAVDADCSLEFHFNMASSPYATGFEMLHWWGSRKSKKLAKSVSDSFSNCFHSVKARGDRGVRSLWFNKWNSNKAYSGRGGAYCYLTPCPAIICEPGFGSNRSDWRTLVDDSNLVGISYARGINNFLRSK